MNALVGTNSKPNRTRFSRFANKGIGMHPQYRSSQEIGNFVLRMPGATVTVQPMRD